MAVSEFTGITDPVYVKAVVSMSYGSGLPEDVVQNTFTFVCQDGTNYLEYIEDTLQAAYDNVTGAYTHDIDRTPGATLTFYDWTIAAPNPPIATSTLTIQAVSGTAYDLPQEVALVCSFEAPTVAGVPMARRRGRVYLGPWCTASAVDSTVPPTSIITATKDFGLDIVTACPLNGTIASWAVLSRKQGGGWLLPGQSGPPNFAAAVSPVTHGWVDNAWDTQRRRGQKATARTTFAFP